MTDEQYEEKEASRGTLYNSMEEYFDIVKEAGMSLLDVAGELQDLIDNTGGVNLTVEIN